MADLIYKAIAAGIGIACLLLVAAVVVLLLSSCGCHAEGFTNVCHT